MLQPSCPPLLVRGALGVSAGHLEPDKEFVWAARCGVILEGQLGIYAHCSQILRSA